MQVTSYLCITSPSGNEPQDFDLTLREPTGTIDPAKPLGYIASIRKRSL